MATTKRMLVIGAGVLIVLVAFSAAGARFMFRHEPPPPTWSSLIGQVDDALSTSDISAAERAWHDAYGAALGSRSWEGMMEVGDASLRIGAASSVSGPSVARARDAYLIALFRARHAGSVDGVLRTAEAFGRLGDRAVADQCLRIARAVAERTSDPTARARVDAFVPRPARPAGDLAAVQPF